MNLEDGQRRGKPGATMIPLKRSNAAVKEKTTKNVHKQA